MSHIRNILFSAGLLSALFIIQACSDKGTPQDEQREVSQALFSDSITNFTLDVFYEVGAEPRTGGFGLAGNDTWDITQESLEALFSEHTNRTVVVPALLSEMTPIDDQGEAEWTTSELISLGDSLANPMVSDNQARVAVIFLNGTLNGETSVLGVHISGTRFAFVFKDVVNSVGGTGNEQTYVEQATVVHEIGHVLGLVNNGIPMAAVHEDTTHAHHTTNDDCVMYWAVEKSESILGFLTGIIANDELNLFGPESLADARNYHP